MLDYVPGSTFPVLIISLCFFYLSDDRWDFTGSTIVTNGYVRLTPDQRSTSGAIWSNVVCVLLRNQKFRENFTESLAKISTLKIESFRNVATIFKIVAKIAISNLLSKMKILDSIVYI